MIPPLPTAQREAMVGGWWVKGGKVWMGLTMMTWKGLDANAHENGYYTVKYVCHQHMIINIFVVSNIFIAKYFAGCMSEFSTYCQLVSVDMIKLAHFLCNQFGSDSKDSTSRRWRLQAEASVHPGCRREISTEKRWYDDCTTDFEGDFFYFSLRKSPTCSPQSAHITKILMMTVQNPWTVLPLF